MDTQIEDVWDLPKEYKSLIYDEVNYIYSHMYDLPKVQGFVNAVQVASDKLPILYIVTDDTVVLQLIINLHLRFI